jgi:transcriptional repressor of cell division inhibition gene dicB
VGMLKHEAIRHFGSGAALGRALGIQRAAVSKWPEVIPREWAAQIHFLTQGKLKFDPKSYQYCPRAEKSRASVG